MFMRYMYSGKEVSVRQRRCNKQQHTHLCRLLGIAVKALKQSGDDAVHSTTCAALEQDAEGASSSLQTLFTNTSCLLPNLGLVTCVWDQPSISRLRSTNEEASYRPIEAP